jgi:hypothetical protein
MMFIRAYFVFFAVIFAVTPPAGAQGFDTPSAAAQTPADVRVIEISTAAELESLLAQPLYDVEIRLLPGEYRLTPKSGVDATCGNCDDPKNAVPMTYGLEIRGERVSIVGPEDRSAVVYTHAGYGLYFNGCSDCALERLSITGGARDTDGRATDAAVVVKDGSVRVTGNRIFDNIGDSTLVATNVVGIMGVCGREDSQLTIEENEILRNSWDGIALYRGASAFIERNTIDGVDKARGAQVGGGRGVGIGVTWNATADIRDNLVKRYWKGIGVFVDAWGYVRGNIVEDVVTWGIAYWDAEKGKPVGIFEDNVIYNTGACGASIACAETVGPELDCRFIGNVLVQCAQDPKYDDPDYYCYQTALAVHAKPEGFAIEDNVFFDNRRVTKDLPDQDVSQKEFLAKIKLVCERLSRTSPSKESDFVRDFCKGKSGR